MGGAGGFPNPNGSEEIGKTDLSVCVKETTKLDEILVSISGLLKTREGTRNGGPLRHRTEGEGDGNRWGVTWVGK